MSHVTIDNTIFATKLSERGIETPTAQGVDHRVEVKALAKVDQLDEAADQFVRCLMRCVVDQRRLFAKHQIGGSIALARLADQLQAKTFGVPDGVLNRHGLLRFAQDLIGRRAVEINKLVQESSL